VKHQAIFFLASLDHFFLSAANENLLGNSFWLYRLYILWRRDPLLGKDLETNNDTTAVAMQQRGKYDFTTIELLLEMEICNPLLGNCNSWTITMEMGCYLCGPYWEVILKTIGATQIGECGVEYLHRDPASRRRRRKESLESETVKRGHEYRGTRTWEWLRWRGSVTIVNDRPVLSSERAPHIN
jgi:hypothetical protein